jgi:hypothetical protein
MRTEAEIREAIEVIEKTHAAHTQLGHTAEAFQLSFVRSALLWALGKDSAFARSFLERQRRELEAFGRSFKAQGN